MKNINATCGANPQFRDCLERLFAGWANLKYALAAVAIIALMMVMPVSAQTITLTITNGTHNYWAGVNTSNSLPANSIAVTETGGGATTNIVMALAGVDGITVFGTMKPSTLTSNGASVMTIAVTNAATGFYPLTVNASDAANAANASTNFNLFVVPQWATTNIGTIGNWSASSNWSGGTPPLSSDGVYIERYTPGPWTNVVDSSRTIQSLVYLGNGDEGASASLAVSTTIPSPNQLSVLGTNGFYMGQRSNTSIRPYYAFQGGGSLLVSNTAADFVINGATGNATRYLIADFSGLNNLFVYANRVAIADMKDNINGPDGCTLVGFYMAQTNLIVATNTDNYNNPVFNTAISYMREDQSANNGQSGTAQIRLGQNNTFYADSLGIGIGDAPGSGSTPFANSIGYRMVFRAPDSVGTTNSVVFRNADGVSRMSLLAIGVDQGLKTQITGNRGVLDLRGGKVDMLVNQIWIAQDRTNTANANGNDVIGALLFDWGKIDCNTLIVGNMKYTNNIKLTAGDGILGSVSIGTNGTLVVNSNLILGQTPADVTGFETQAANVSGQIQINNGGTLRASQITVGQFSGNNAITINAGGTLDVSNTVTSGSGPFLGTLANNGGTNVLHMNGANTLIYVSNLTATAGSKITIASVAGAVLNTPIPVIYFVNGTTPNNYGWSGVGPVGINVVIGTTANSVTVTLSTGAPKTLRWVGGMNNVWDTSATSTNWQDTVTGLYTNFNTGDNVIFDDTASQFNVNVAANVFPSQSGIGIAMTNTTPYTFTTTGGGQISGGASLVKQGAGSLTIDLYTELAATLGQGSLATTGAGTIGSVVGAAGTAFANGGNVLGNVAISGTANNTGTIIGTLTTKSSSLVTNAMGGIVQGALSIQSGSFLYNVGTFSGLGSATIATNATFINAGTIANGGNNAGSLSVNGTFEDMGVAAGSTLNLSALIINGGGTFIPGGDGIGTTKVTGDGTAPDGRVQFLTGSTNIFKVNSTNSQTCTLLTSAYMGFGPSQSTFIQNGGTILMTNVGPAYAAGQSFTLVQNNFGGAPFAVNNGTNTVNSLSVMSPSAPATGLLWDLSQLIGGGVIGIKTTPTVGTNVVLNTSPLQTISTNIPPITNNYIVTELKWPSDYIGWHLQQQQNTLAVGLFTNWTDVASAQFTNDIYFTNSVTIPSAFYRMKSP